MTVVTLDTMVMIACDEIQFGPFLHVTILIIVSHSCTVVGSSLLLPVEISAKFVKPFTIRLGGIHRLKMNMVVHSVCEHVILTITYCDMNFAAVSCTL